MDLDCFWATRSEAARSWALNTLKDQDEKIQLPNFYQNVIAATARDMELLAALPDNDEEMQELFGNASFLHNARGVELRRREIFDLEDQ